MLHIRVGERKWTYVCENVLEAQALNIEYKPWFDCQKGEYALTDNGWVVEVLNQVVYEPSGTRKYPMLSYEFYKQKIFVRYENYCLDTKTFTFEYSPNTGMRYLSTNAKAMLKLIDSGVNIIRASYMCYSPKHRDHILLKLLNTPLFIEKLKETSYFMNIKESFHEAGVTPDILAKKIKESIDSDNFKEKQWAVDLALEYLTKTDKTNLSVNITNVSTPELQAGIDSYMLHKVPGILPERIEDAVVIDSESINT